MTDEAFVQALESCRLPEREFGHAGHMRAAYVYLRDGDFVEALARTRRTIRNYARHLQKPDRYHETITVAYVTLIAQHMFERGAGAGWADFARQNVDLLERDLLRRFYPEGQLASDAARLIFLLPRPQPLRNDRCA